MEQNNKGIPSTFLMLNVSGETFRLEVFCLIFSRCSWETIFVPIFVIFFSMFCRENAFFRLSTCRERTSQTCLSEHLSVWLNTCLWFLPSSDWNVSVSLLWISPCSPDHEATPPLPLAPLPARHPHQMIGRWSGVHPPGNGYRPQHLLRILPKSHHEGTEEDPSQKHWRGSRSLPEEQNIWFVFEEHYLENVNFEGTLGQH